MDIINAITEYLKTNPHIHSVSRVKTTITTRLYNAMLITIKLTDTDIIQCLTPKNRQTDPMETITIDPNDPEFFNQLDNIIEETAKEPPQWEW